MQVTSIVVEGRLCRDMYDEHPGFAYFYVDAQRRIPVPHPLSMAEGKTTAEVVWRRLHATVSTTDEYEEYDGQFTPSRILLLARDRTVLQQFESDSWVTGFDPPDQWAALLERAGELAAQASYEAGWDNFSTAEGLRWEAANLRRRVCMAKAHYGVLTEPAPTPAPTPSLSTQPMRGLDERAALALARIAGITDPEKAEEDLMLVALEAEALGVREYREGIHEPPVMFADEPLLLNAWKEGQSYAHAEAMED